MRFLYQLAVLFVLLVAGPYFLLKRGEHYRPTLPGRLGRYGPAPENAPEKRLWIHAVSVGEVGVAATVVNSLPEDLPLVVTTVTPTGQKRAHELFAKRRAEIAYLPFDLGFFVGRFLRRFRPAALILCEGDYWPLTLKECARWDLPVAVINGRVSDRSFTHLRLIRPLLGSYFGAVGSFGVQTGEDRQRLLALGIEEDRVTVTGNLKFDSPEPATPAGLEEEIRRLAEGRPILAAGSTMEGEDEQVLDAFEKLGGGERALLVIAPRHPERFDAVAGLLAERGLTHARRSVEESGERPAVLLLDTLGELAALYRFAAAAFVGGTLVATGGHNPLEPARFGVPVVVGPSMTNFQGMETSFRRAGAWRQVKDAGELAEVWSGWLDDPGAAREIGQRGAALVEDSRGALEKTLELIEPLVRAVEKSR